VVASFIVNLLESNIGYRFISFLSVFFGYFLKVSSRKKKKQKVNCRVPPWLVGVSSHHASVEIVVHE